MDWLRPRIALDSEWDIARIFGGLNNSVASRLAGANSGSKLCDNAAQMQTYCDDESDCRHAQLVMHFGDANTFPGGRCGGGCDNCRRAGGIAEDNGVFDWEQFDVEARHDPAQL